MSEFSVAPGQVEELSAGLRGISGGVNELHGQAGQHASAAADTSVDGALSGLMGHWSSVLPQFALAGDSLHVAMRGAAAAYQATDTAVGNAAAGSEQAKHVEVGPQRAKHGVEGPTERAKHGAQRS